MRFLSGQGTMPTYSTPLSSKVQKMNFNDNGPPTFNFYSNKNAGKSTFHFNANKNAGNQQRQKQKQKQHTQTKLFTHPHQQNHNHQKQIQIQKPANPARSSSPVEEYGVWRGDETLSSNNSAHLDGSSVNSNVSIKQEPLDVKQEPLDERIKQEPSDEADIPEVSISRNLIKNKRIIKKD